MISKLRLDQLARQLAASAHSTAPIRSLSTSRAPPSEHRAAPTQSHLSAAPPLPSPPSTAPIYTECATATTDYQASAPEESCAPSKFGSSNSSDTNKARRSLNGNRLLAVGGIRAGGNRNGVRFASSFTIPNGNGGTVDLAFPRKSNPTPWEIFHFAETDPLPNPRIIKARYFELSRLYHPDTKSASTVTNVETKKGKEKATSSGDTSKEFRMICSAYEILKSPSKRAVYLRSGYGFSGNHGGASSSRSGSSRNPGYDFSRGPSMRNGGSAYARGEFSLSPSYSSSLPRVRVRLFANPISKKFLFSPPGAYPSAAWDFGAGWTDPHNPHFRPGESSAYSSSYPSPSPHGTGWHANGLLTNNGTVFLALLAVTIIVTPLSVWSLVPPDSIMPDSAIRNAVIGGNPIVEPDWRGMQGGRDRRHNDAARALDQARREARIGGLQKREAIKRRVRAIERERALQRALEVESIERQTKGTGHLSLAPPERGLPDP